MKTVYFITHPEVVIAPSVPVPQWPLSAQGLVRMRLLLRQPWVPQITAVYCSTEQKAIDGAALLAAHLGLPVSHVVDLGENNRSATGYLPGPKFERVVDQFFATRRSLFAGGSRQRSPSNGLSVRSRTSLHRMPQPVPLRSSRMVGWGHYCCVPWQGMLLTDGMSNPAQVGATITPLMRHRES
jgi:hypothetical protein